MKQITIAGGLTKDAELRRLQNGDPILNFSVGVSEGRDKPSTYFGCSLWGKRGEALEQYLKKGAKVTVMGDLSAREYNGKTYLEVRVDAITLQGGKQEGSRDESQGYASSGGTAAGGNAGYGAGGRPSLDDGDTIPFAPEWR